MKTLNNFSGALIATLLAILTLKYREATEKLLDTIWEDQESYCLDVLSETDEYQDYLEAKEDLSNL